MANIFSGLFSGGGGGSASSLQRQKDAMEQHNALMEYKRRNEDIIDQIPAYDKAIEQMTPERQNGFKQRGVTIKDQASEAAKLKRFKEERDYKLANPEDTDYKKNLATFTALGDGSGTYTPAQIKALQFQGREKFVDTGIAQVSTIDPNKKIDYQFTEAAMRRGMGDKQTDEYIGFEDQVAASDTFMTNMLRKRESVQELFGMSTDSNMGFESIFSYLYGTEQRDWRQVKDQVVANIGIDALLEMKQSSPTGASGLGQLSDTEMRILTALVGSLDQAGSPERAQEILKKIDAQYANMEKARKLKLRQINRRNRAVEEKYPASLPEEYRYIIADEYKYLLNDEFTKPGRESPLIKQEPVSAADYLKENAP